MVPILLAVGSNLGNREANLSTGLEALKAEIHIEQVSSFIETQPYGVKDQPCFLNGALWGETELTPQELLTFIKEIEKKCGRYETFRWGPRVLDIDIIFYDNIFYQSRKLTIPHKDMLNRAFVLQPALEIIPDRNDLIWKGFITGTIIHEFR